MLGSRFSIALALFVGAALTDVLDGMVARMFEARSRLGAFLDPAADKLMLTSAFVLLTDYPQLFSDLAMVQRIPLWLTVLTISRDVLIVCISLALYLAHRQTSFPPSRLGKLTTFSEIVTVSFFLLHNALGRPGLAPEVLVWTTLAMTLVSGFHYLNRTIHMLRRDEAGLGPPGGHG